ncbi:MAG TPA: gamma-glutamyl-gamma-aminobutyrate hydrolase family protein [Acidimicrobiales bacterium]|nr:gamma-glutamyl-gamma-aminobutyrate hydrolase family protein [Acidimicrobiales bacterium]
MKPVIGISAYPRLVETSLGATLLHTTSRFYVESVERAGGVPVVLPVMSPEAVDDVLPVVHGVLLSGGGDIQPSRYGAKPVAETSGVDPARDDFDIRLLELAIEAEVPVLATCRGMQVLNVALGGSLIQHVPAATGQVHYRNDRWREGVHRVKIEPDSQLAEALGATEVEVNSIHHQAVDQAAPGTRAVAWADDDTVEAIELPGSPHVVAVQWHPELLEDWPEQQGLFRQLVEHARRRMPRSAGRAAG